MLKEQLEPDFLGTGQSTSEEDTARVSAWIKEQEKQKKKAAPDKKSSTQKRRKTA